MEYFQEFVTKNLLTMPSLAVNLFIFVLAYIESLPIITVFFPGMMVAVIIGGLTHISDISPLVAINLLALGSFLGDVTSLYAGPHLLKIKWFKEFVEKEKYQKHWSFFDKHIAWILILCKVLPFIRSTPSLFAGARNISKTKYFTCTFFGSYLWSAVAIFGGNLLGQAFGILVIPVVVIIFILIGVVTYFIKK